MDDTDQVQSTQDGKGKDLSTDEEMLNFLSEWLTKQDLWMQHAANKLRNKENLEDEEIKRLCDILKNPASAPPIIEARARKDAKSPKLRLFSVGSIHNIAALTPGKTLLLAPEKDRSTTNMSIIYGLNGSGKSSYVNILKYASGKTSSPPLPNIYHEKSENQNQQNFEIKYKLNHETKTYAWDSKTHSDKPLQGLEIFDSSVQRVYLNEEKEYEYRPPALDLHTRLVATVEKVNKCLEDEQKPLSQSKLTTMPPQYQLTKVAKKYKEPANHRDALTTWNDELNNKLQNDTQRLQDLKNPITKQKELATKKIYAEYILGPLQNAFAAVSGQALEQLRAQHQLVREHNKAYCDAKHVFAKQPVAGVNSDSWEMMWKAARAYSQQEAYRSAVFPHTGEDSRCVLCQQTLDQQAQERLQRFENFVTNNLAKELDTAKQQLNSLIAALPPLPNSELLESQSVIANISPELKEELSAVRENLTIVFDVLRQLPQSGNSTMPPVADVEPTLEKLRGHISAIEKQIEDLKLEDPEKLQELESNIAELRAQEWTAQQTESINEEILRLNEYKKYVSWINETNTKSLTLISNDISHKYITKDYLKRLESELSELGSVLKVTLVQKNAKGRTKYAISLSTQPGGQKHPVEKILSEGEQRLVALAACLANVSAKKAATPFIFDDPISSLDDVFEEKVAERLAKLYQERQVIVFTHRLSFLAYLIDKSTAPHHVAIEKSRDSTGVPDHIPLTIDPYEGLENLKIKLNGLRTRNPHDSEYKSIMSSICTDFRKILESVVEKILLKGIVKRLHHKVEMRYIKGLFTKKKEEDCKTIAKAWTTYSTFEHDQSAERSYQPPTIEQIEKDIDTIKKLCTEKGKNKETSPAAQTK